MGTTGLTAQAFGAADEAEIRASLARPLALALGLVLMALAPAVIRRAQLLFEPSSAVQPELASYLWIRLFGAPAAHANLVSLGWLLGLQDARGPLILLIATNGLNVALDLVFVLGFGWATAGVAAATLVAEWSGHRN